MAHPKEILAQLEANARKSLSQNFLTSPHWAEKLSKSALEVYSDEVWEVGPGLGALTKPLLQFTDRPVRLFEYDRKLSQYLREIFPSVPLIEGDFLKAPFLELLSDGKTVSLLSNLPYHLSSPVLFKCVEWKSQMRRLTLTFQREFAERLKANAGDDAYGGLSVMVRLHFDVESLGILPAKAFYPAPSIDSEALVFTPKKNELPPSLEKVVRAGFAHRRKKLSRNLKNEYASVDWEGALKNLGFSPDARAEELSPEHFLALAALVKI
jgi:16S rRNA (adenine1518-N6/adenine1519-N6)-dimethyltransferase